MSEPFTAETAEKKAFHGISGSEALAFFHVDDGLGLSDAEASRRRQRFGLNVLEKAKTRTLWQILVSQFKSLIVFLLAAAVALSFSFGQTTEGLAILAVIVINAAIGFFTELKGIRSMEALRSLARVEARVRRGGEVKEIQAENLVPGDIVILDAGDVVAADLRLLQASRLRADESILTGESLPVTKKTRRINQKTPLPERANMAFQGTGIMLGAGAGVVTATGLHTELGKIAHLAETAEDAQSPLEKRITFLGHQLVWMTLILALVVGGFGLFSDIPFYLTALTAIALAVAAVPEGLPMVATLALARGMWRMSKKNALIERLSAVETLGSTTVIMVDKTGTMTENRMTATWLALPGSDVQVLPKKGGQGAIFKRNGTHLNLSKNKELWPLFRTSVLCNTAYLEEAVAGTHRYEGVGDPTEVALLVLGAQAGFFHHKLIEKYPEIHIEAFDPELKMMASLHRVDGKILTAVKGAPEEVVKYCTKIAGRSGEKAMTEAARKDWRAKSAKLAAKGLRVLAIAEKVTQRQGKKTYEGLTLLGLVGLHDPPRQDVPGAIKACRRAGVQVIMVTGDHAVTAREISHAIGLASEKDKVIEGGQWEDLAGLAGHDLKAILLASVFARVSPKQKLDLIGLYQEQGHIVAMTGDGVNDAPALRKADIGIAMGRRGSQVAREAADIILRDDAFSTIVAAIAQGRVIFGNIRNFIVYLLSCNLSEILVVGLAFLSGLPLPLLPLQILFLNLVTDVFPAFALGAGEGEKGIMKAPPRDPKEPILPKFLWGGIIGLGGIMTAAVLGAFTFAIWGLDMDASTAVTVSFLTLGFAQLWHVFNMRKADSGILLNEISRNPFVWGALALCSGLLLAAQLLPWLAGLLGLSPIGWAAWGTVFICSLAPLAVVQALKWLRIVS